ncbi:hypothetical protein K491DRAFT_609215 [Lophiostoma macrostomum CBS 122681]|uniref:EthD domain-containing protein n=1 Tax=Lophiostoma macrostomum CBS 122681 TaxID=1314788 RepID=A0A6A6ST62_9PLEO|nr:hypothetical protein K491DRAFT_609215 [Lophiostoma macrostomum CBS 122681]
MDKHNFTFSHLRPGQGSNQQPYLRLLIFISKRPDISEETFHEWWKTVHADLSASAPGWGVHVLRYVQSHQTSQHKEALEAAGMETLQYDGMGELHVKSLDDWIKFSSSKYFIDVMSKDGPNFMAGPIHMMLGYDNLITGAKIETSGGADGILPGDKRLTPLSKL